MSASICAPRAQHNVPCMYMQKSAWIALPCLALPAESARPPKKQRCADEQMQETRSVGGGERGVGQQGVRRQPLRVQPTQVCEELHCPRRMLLQHSETCADPALSIAVVPQEASGGWLQQQGGEYHLISCFLQRPVCVPFGCLIPWTMSYRIGYWNINRSEIMTIDTYCGPQSVGFEAIR